MRLSFQGIWRTVWRAEPESWPAGQENLPAEWISLQPERADLQCRVVRIGEKYTVSCTQGEKVSGHRPSVDAMFHSMAETVSCKMVGIIMTGMGQDGAVGLLEMRKKGAYTIGQDKESSVVYGMPGVAQNIGAVMIQASCENVANVLVRHLKTLG